MHIRVGRLNHTRAPPYLVFIRPIAHTVGIVSKTVESGGGGGSGSGGGGGGYNVCHG